MVEPGNRCASLDHGKDDPEGRSDTTPSQPGKHAKGAESPADSAPVEFSASAVPIAGHRDWSWGRTTRHDHPHPRAFRRPIRPMRALRILRFSGGSPPSRAPPRFGGPPAFATTPPIAPNTAAGIRQTAPREQLPRPGVAPRVTAPGQPADCPRWALRATRSVDCAPSPAPRAAPTGPASTPPSPGATT